jgi:preprotein translocase subunit SecE
MAEQASVRREEPSAMQAALEQTKGNWRQFTEYVAEVKIETRKVTWPGKQEIYGTTVMVVITTFLFGIYFWLCDTGFQYAVSHALQYFMHHRS